MNRPLRIGTRGSKLALAQAGEVKEALEKQGQTAGYEDYLKTPKAVQGGKVKEMRRCGSSFDKLRMYPSACSGRRPEPVEGSP